MRKILFIVVLTTTLLSCKNDTQNTTEQINNPITFTELDSVSSMQMIAIKNFLKEKGFKFSKNQTDSEQWKLGNTQDLIQFNGKGVVLYMTVDDKKSNSILEELKNSNYQYTGLSENSGTEVHSYSKENKTILQSKITNTNTNEVAISFTFLSK